jgi:hypothetical protein
MSQLNGVDIESVTEWEESYSVVTVDGRSHGVPKDESSGFYRAVQDWIDDGGTVVQGEEE